MAEIIDFKTKKKMELPKSKSGYRERISECIAKEQQTGKMCACETCVTKKLLAARLVTISNWLCLDYMEKNKSETLYWGDWLDIMVLALAQVQATVTLPKGTK